MQTRILSMLLAILLMSPLYGQDTLVFKNGDEIHGKLKRMDQKIAVVKTPYSKSDFRLKWERINGIVSTRKFNVYLKGNKRFIASFRSAQDDNAVILVQEDLTEKEVLLSDIVSISYLDSKFSERFDATLSAGMTITKADKNRQLSLRGSAAYRSMNWFADLSFNSVRNDREESIPISRSEGNINFNYLFYKNWFASLKNQFLNSDEQQLRLRNTHILSVGNFIIRSNKMYLWASGGVAYNREDYTNNTNIFNSSEGFLGIEFNIYDVGDLSLLGKVSYFPSISRDGRNRVNLNYDLKYEFPLDFFIKLGYTYNFDSKPPNQGSKDDFIFQTTVGWEF